jgi:hypothetical protein
MILLTSDEGEPVSNIERNAVRVLDPWQRISDAWRLRVSLLSQSAYPAY